MNDAVYVLAPVVDDPRFHGFRMADNSSILGSHDINDDFAAWEGVAKLLSPRWKPHELRGEVGPHNDFPAAGCIPIFSGRAVTTLKSLLEPNGELLQCRTQSGSATYWAYNVTTVCDALDLAESIVDPDGAQSIKHHDFRTDQLIDRSIFKLPQDAFEVYVTQRFVDCVLKYELKGFWFKKVWPLPRGTNWRRQAREELKQGQTVRLSNGESSSGSNSKNITCRPPSAGEELDSLTEALHKYQGKLGLDAVAITPDDIQSRIAKELDRVRSSHMNREEKMDRAFWCAVAWGESIKKELGWDWAMLVKDGGAKTMGIVSRNHSYAVPVFQFIETIAVDNQKDQTSKLLFNLIRNGEVPPAMSGELRLLG